MANVKTYTIDLGFGYDYTCLSLPGGSRILSVDGVYWKDGGLLMDISVLEKDGGTVSFSFHVVSAGKPADPYSLGRYIGNAVYEDTRYHLFLDAFGAKEGDVDDSCPEGYV